ncbi:MAG: hypothetical protein DMG30_20325 [Acidobacteria bacterium]|nr:MAG: hypothetical protein DMG30_20325 [Acidobacteriota bacterium]
MELVTPAATRYGHSDFGRDSQSKISTAPRLRFERNGRHGLQEEPDTAMSTKIGIGGVVTQSPLPHHQDMRIAHPAVQ